MYAPDIRYMYFYTPLLAPLYKQIRRFIAHISIFGLLFYLVKKVNYKIIYRYTYIFLFGIVLIMINILDIYFLTILFT